MYISTAIPTQIIQQDSESPTPGEALVEWKFSENFISPDSYAETAKPLKTIAGTNGMLFRNCTKELWTSEYNFNLPGSIILGVELVLKTRRVSRIQDYTIQLCLNDQLIGDNQAILHHVPENLTTYGSLNNTWGVELTKEDIESNSFGVVISFQSNDQCPHYDRAFVDQIELRIYSA